MPRPPGWKVRENAPLLPGGGWALLELTDALLISMIRRKDNNLQSCKHVLNLFSNSKFSHHQTGNLNIRIRLILIIIRKMPRNLRTGEVKQN